MEMELAFGSLECHKKLTALKISKILDGETKKRIVLKPINMPLQLPHRVCVSHTYIYIYKMYRYFQRGCFEGGN